MADDSVSSVTAAVSAVELDPAGSVAGAGGSAPPPMHEEDPDDAETALVDVRLPHTKVIVAALKTAKATVKRTVKGATIAVLDQSGLDKARNVLRYRCSACCAADMVRVADIISDLLRLVDAAAAALVVSACRPPSVIKAAAAAEAAAAVAAAAAANAAAAAASAAAAAAALRPSSLTIELRPAEVGLAIGRNGRYINGIRERYAQCHFLVFTPDAGAARYTITGPAGILGLVRIELAMRLSPIYSGCPDDAALRRDELFAARIRPCHGGP